MAPSCVPKLLATLLLLFSFTTFGTQVTDASLHAFECTGTLTVCSKAALCDISNETDSDNSTAGNDTTTAANTNTTGSGNATTNDTTTSAADNTTAAPTSTAPDTTTAPVNTTTDTVSGVNTTAAVNVTAGNTTESTETYTCTCKAGYKVDNSSVCQATCEVDWWICGAGAKCVSGKCVCRDGFKGEEEDGKLVCSMKPLPLIIAVDIVLVVVTVMIITHLCLSRNRCGDRCYRKSSKRMNKMETRGYQYSTPYQPFQGYTQPNFRLAMYSRNI